MEFVKRWMAQIQSQLADVPVSTKMLFGALSVIMLSAIILVVVYASSAKYVVLLDQSMTADRISQIRMVLARNGVDMKVSGDRVLVSEESADLARALVAGESLLPQDTSDAFDEIVQNQTWWHSSRQNEQMWLAKKMQVLSKIISKMRSVRSASVIIDIPTQEGFGTNYQPPTASVNIMMANGQVDQNLVDAVAGLVSGAVAKMKPEHVTVTDAVAGRAWAVRQEGEVLPSDYLNVVRGLENHYHTKIASALQSIDGVIIAVNVEIDHTRRKTQRHQYDRDSSVELLESESVRSVENSEQTPTGEAGVRPNTGASIAGSSNRGMQNSIEEEERRFQPFAGEISTQEYEPGGVPTKVHATVNIPRSYFLQIYQGQQEGEAPQANQVTDAQLQPVIDDYVQRVTRMVEPLIASKDSGNVMVQMYPDITLASSSPDQATMADSGMMGMFDESTMKYGAIIGLSMLALGMMLMMIRKAAHRPPQPSVAELAGLPASLPADDNLVGEAGTSDSALTGMEIDEDEIRNHQLVEQVSQMIKGNPAEAATLLNRWIQKSD